MQLLVIIVFHINNVVLHSKLGLSLQRLLNKLYEFYTSSNLDVIISKTKIMMFGDTKGSLLEVCPSTIYRAFVAKFGELPRQFHVYNLNIDVQ